jgi:beta-aspartyl-peptidase (threonine type)
MPDGDRESQGVTSVILRIRLLLLFLVTLHVPCLANDSLISNTDAPIADVVLGIHGGIGDADQELTPDLLKQFRATMEESLRQGAARIHSGGSSLDGVETAIRVLEDSPLFNAGRGAVFTHAGRNELDASIMDGRTRSAGAVAGVTTVKNPITAARTVMEKSKHVLLVGQGAEAFAKRQGLDLVEPGYFRTEHRWKALQQVLEQERQPVNNGQGAIPVVRPRKKQSYGTVGAVALDLSGNLAAGTSTGGMTNKIAGRVGDSPIIGAGTYADNAACAVSCTGHGEYFIRYAVAHEIVAQMKYKQVSARESAHDVIQIQLKRATKSNPDDAEGAAIVLDKSGQFTTAFNAPGLFRACITRDGIVHVKLE